MVRDRKRDLRIIQEATPAVKANIHNRFDVEVVEANTGRIKQKAYAENIILNSLWAQIGTTYFSYIHYGSGSGTATATRTSLFTYLGGTSASGATTAVDFTTGVFSVKKMIQLSETTAVGCSLTEVGVAYSTSSSSLVTHAMLKDMNGNQISIAKTNTDIINIYATIFVHFNPDGYANGSIKFVATDLLNIIAGGAAFASVSAEFDYGKGYGFEYTPTNTTSLSYSNISASKQIKGTATRLAAGSNNVGGLGQVIVGGIRFVTTSNGWFTGSAITGEAVATGDGTTTDFALDFPNADTATIYIDGVAQSSGVTVAGLPNTVNFGSELNCIDASGNPKWSAKALNFLYWWDRTATLYYENPFYQTIGMKVIRCFSTSAYVYASNDLVNWTKIINNSTAAYTIPDSYRNYRYWKTTNSYIYDSTGFEVIEITATKAVHFDTPPASGAVITADYTSRMIAKDLNHVFDFVLTITLGEKTT